MGKNRTPGLPGSVRIACPGKASDDFVLIPQDSLIALTEALVEAAEVANMPLGKLRLPEQTSLRAAIKRAQRALPDYEKALRCVSDADRAWDISLNRLIDDVSGFGPLQ